VFPAYMGVNGITTVHNAISCSIPHVYGG